MRWMGDPLRWAEEGGTRGQRRSIIITAAAAKPPFIADLQRSGLTFALDMCRVVRSLPGVLWSRPATVESPLLRRAGRPESNTATGGGGQGWSSSGGGALQLRHSFSAAIHE